ncbi:urea transporter [Empedobacter sp. 225-1]|uniref:Urea transporter n=1 Tax=Empedobacter falsenii TaxID=343874 RepID=A0ABY8V789_9FLAO|nr:MULTISPECIES: urea transporter [Empedobacter]MDM1522025.1 urea transporter [Empedobacter sp. 225-1]MDM1542294.1 urea transporter [Empedobacter sp. 189-2]WIH97529.1 urea transporter [Empedobacter falsenii]
MGYKLGTRFPFVDQVLKGIGQIMLQENSGTGLLFLIGIFLGSTIGGIGVLMATCVGTITAIILKYNSEEINAGLYGFSAALVGVGLTVLFESTFLLWVLLVVFSALATVIQHFFNQRNIAGYTFPFIILTWVLIYGIHHFTSIKPLVSSEDSLMLAVNQFLVPTNSFGEVIFQSNPLSGILFFVAVFVGTPIAALYGVAASVFSAIFAFYLGAPLDQILMGLFGFNAVLTSIVFAGNKKIDGLWVLIGVVITVLLQILFIQSAIFSEFGGVLTFPFVLGIWITLFLKY